jgi:NAD(P)-dependent dehydrogenase (short-subunit alcohol dehydrogenase family)
MTRFAEQLVLVTGGASGIGEATSRLLSSEGATVVIADVDDDRGAVLADELGAQYVHLDVTDPAAWAALTQGQSFTMAVLNAGVGARFDDLRNAADEIFERVMDVNVGGVFYGTRELFRSMAGRGGRISVTASIASLAAHTQSPIYCASKWAVVGWVRAIAPSMSVEGVQINAVCPGLVDTPILGPGGGDRMRQMGLKVLDAAEVAEAHAHALLYDGTGTIFTIQAQLGLGEHTFNPPAGYPG